MNKSIPRSVLRTTPLIFLNGFVGLIFILLPFPLMAENGDISYTGSKLVDKYACRSCHTIGDEGGLVGPNLNQVTIRRDEEWLLRWLSDPSAIKPGTLMPKFVWADGEREAVIAYLLEFAMPVDKQAILDRDGKGPKAGEALIKAYQCFACHKVAGENGRMLFPDLTTVKFRRNESWEKRWLKDPQAVLPGTFMPNFHLSKEEIDAITQYLYR